MAELRQLFDEQGNPLAGKGATKEDTLKHALLHGASHVWFWRRRDGQVELLWQRRASDKATWPNKLDIPAAGHIDLGEDALTAALREVREEIGVVLTPQELKLFNVYRCYLHVDSSELVENEYQWLYLAELADAIFTLQADEVKELFWKPLAAAKAELADASVAQEYVPHGSVYFAVLFEAIERATI